MIPLTEQQIRSSFVNTSVRERKSIVLPPELESTRWEQLDFLGWRDAKAPKNGYVVVELDGVPTGVLLTQSDAKPRSRAQCSWCADVTLPNEVVFFGTKRAGRSGRNGDTIGTLLCAEFECNANVRRLPPVAYLGFDVEAARQGRISALRTHVANFVRDVRDSD